MASQSMLHNASHFTISGGKFYNVLGNLNYNGGGERHIGQEKAKVLQWLNPIFSTDELSEAMSERVPGTCEWILGEDIFESWVERAAGQDVSSCLWINGPGGFGKTFISGRIVEHLDTLPAHSLAYFFCAHEDAEKRSVISILRSWIAQLGISDSVAFSEIQDMRRGRETISPASTELWTLFKSIVKKVPECRFVLDGLDECATKDTTSRAHFSGARTRFLQNLLQAILDTTATAIITSRDETDIREGLGLSPNSSQNNQVVEFSIAVEDTMQDVGAFARSIVAERLPLQDTTLKDDFARELSSKAQGMFLWVRLEKARIKPSQSPSQLRKVISEMPTGVHLLHNTYERSLLAISELQEQEDRDRAERILRWVLFAARPLSVRELIEALLIRDGIEQIPHDNLPSVIDEGFVEAEIVALCGSLISVRPIGAILPAAWTVHLAHFSVKEFLLKSNTTISTTHFNSDIYQNERLNHFILAKACVSYLLLRDCFKEPRPSKDAFQEELGTLAFLQYTSLYWAHHSRSYGGDDSSLVSLTARLLESGKRRPQLWEQVYFAHYSTTTYSFGDSVAEYREYINKRSASPLYYVCMLGLVHAARDLISRGYEVNEIGGSYETSLHAAAHWGYTDIVALLLQNGAAVHIMNDTGSALHEAAEQGHESTTSTLLEHGANLQAQNKSGDTPLHLATNKQHISLCRLLVAKGSDISIENEGDQTPLLLLLAGSYTGSNELPPLELVRLLISDNTINIQDRSSRTALSHSSYREGFFSVTQLLLSLGADPDPHGFEESPLFSSLRRYQPETAIELLKYGANPYRKCWGRKTTPLHMAARRHYTGVVRKMLDSSYGSKPNHSDDYGVRVLHDTIGSNDDSFGITPWSSNGDKTVELLLERGAAPNPPTTGGSWSPGPGVNAPLHMAAARGLVNVVKMLMERGVSIDSSDEFGYTPLHFAVSKSQENAVKVLLECGANVNAVTNVGMTPLHFATRGKIKRAAVVKGSIANMLIKAGADVNMKDSAGNYPFKDSK